MKPEDAKLYGSIYALKGLYPAESFKKAVQIRDLLLQGLNCLQDEITEKLIIEIDLSVDVISDDDDEFFVQITYPSHPCRDLLMPLFELMLQRDLKTDDYYIMHEVEHDACKAYHDRFVERPTRLPLLEMTLGGEYNRVFSLKMGRF